MALFVSKDVEVLLNVEESRIGQISLNQNAALRVAAYPGQDFPAVVTSIAPVASKDTHTFPIKITPADEKGLLRSGMYADVAVLAQASMARVLPSLPPEAREKFLTSPRSGMQQLARVYSGGHD